MQLRSGPVDAATTASSMHASCRPSARSSIQLGFGSCNAAKSANASAGVAASPAGTAERPDNAATTNSPAPSPVRTNAPTVAPDKRRAASVTVCITRSASSSSTRVWPTSRRIWAIATICRSCS